MNSFIAETYAAGFTYYERAAALAFEIVAKSDRDGVGSNCTRVYIFLSDGEPSEKVRRLGWSLLLLFGRSVVRLSV